MEMQIELISKKVDSQSKSTLEFLKKASGNIGPD